MKNRPAGIISLLLLVAALAIVVSGCPTLEIVSVGVNPGSIKKNSFTLESRVLVKSEKSGPAQAGEEEGADAGVTSEPAAGRIEGHGVLGVWMPEGWKATGARVREPDSNVFVEMKPLEGREAEFPPPFPYVPGRWWVYASESQGIKEGEWPYALEVDIHMPEGTSYGSLGLSITILDRVMHPPHPREVFVDLDAMTAGFREDVARQQSMRVSPGARGCSCDAAGMKRSSGLSFVGLIPVLSGVLLP